MVLRRRGTYFSMGSPYWRSSMMACDELLGAHHQADHRLLAGVEFADHRQDVLGGHLVENFDQGVIALLLGEDDEVGFGLGDLAGQDEFAGFLDD